MADHGLKISKIGVDVLAETANSRNLIFNSVKNHLKIIKSAEYSYTFSSNPGAGRTNLVSIAHGQSFKPAHDLFYKRVSTGGFSRAPWYLISDAFPDITDYIINSEVDGTNLVIWLARIDYGAGNPIDLTGEEFLFRYRIFGDRGL